MRSITLLLLALLPFYTIAQKQVIVSIQHGIDGEELEMGKVWQHPYGAFSVFRLQYYLSDITLIHDGGQQKELKGLYLLVNSNQSDYDLGSVDVGQIEGINFKIGVDSSTNHADPALWPAGHPLAYQDPSMHWGWTSGYRFLAFEGLFDYNKDGEPEKVWEFHAVGDILLTPVSLAVPTADGGDKVRLTVKADYDRLFNNGVHIDNILHGDGTLVQEMMQNFNAGPVFHGAELISSTTDERRSVIGILPMGNPAIGSARLKVSLPAGVSGTVTIFDFLGNQVFKSSDRLWNGSMLELPSLFPGHYLALLTPDKGAGMFCPLVIVE